MRFLLPLSRHHGGLAVTDASWSLPDGAGVVVEDFDVVDAARDAYVFEVTYEDAEINVFGT